MKQYEEKLRKYIEVNKVKAQQLFFNESCHTVAEAANALRVAEDEIVKNICLMNEENQLILVVVKGEDRVSTSRVGKVLGIETPRVATPDEILNKTGYLCGGVPSFGFKATYIIDSKVMDKEVIYTGGGSENAMARITTKELQKANNGMVVRVRR